MKILLFLDMPTVEVDLEEVWPDGDEPDEITQEAIVDKVKEDLHDFFFLTEGYVSAHIVRPAKV